MILGRKLLEFVVIDKQVCVHTYLYIKIWYGKHDYSKHRYVKQEYGKQGYGKHWYSKQEYGNQGYGKHQSG